MNNERYNQILSELYYKFLEWQFDNQISVDPPWSKDSFIKACKTDYEFLAFWGSHWGLKIEERELSLEERSLIANSNHYEVSLNIKGIGVDGDVTLHTHLDELNIPTKLITLTYNNETIEVYE